MKHNCYNGTPTKSRLWSVYRTTVPGIYKSPLQRRYIIFFEIKITVGEESFLHLFHRSFLRAELNRCLSSLQASNCIPILTSIFKGSINHSTIIKPTFHPILRSPVFLRTRSRRSLALDHEMQRSICLPTPLSCFVWIYKRSIGRLYVVRVAAERRGRRERGW